MFKHWSCTPLSALCALEKAHFSFIPGDPSIMGCYQTKIDKDTGELAERLPTGLKSTKSYKNIQFSLPFNKPPIKIKKVIAKKE